ncbi:MAG: aldehyde dehydrogenase family protein [Gammaproteobacteria bacterium]
MLRLLGWRDTALDDRITLLQRFGAVVQQRQAELVELISRENGKPRWDAQTEVAATSAKSRFRFRPISNAPAVSKTTVRGQLRCCHKPHGVVMLLGPFNFPAHLPNGYIVPALLAGNCVVFKPSEQTPAVAQFLMECWQTAGSSPRRDQFAAG